MTDARHPAAFIEAAGYPFPVERPAGVTRADLTASTNLTTTTEMLPPGQQGRLARFKPESRYGRHAAPKGKKANQHPVQWGIRRSGDAFLVGRLAKEDRKKNVAAGRASVAPAVRHDVPSGVDREWAELGQEVGFMPVWNQTAVIEYRKPTYSGVLGKIDAAPNKVARLSEVLAQKGFDGFTTVVAVPTLPAEATDAICDGGAYLIEVPETFWALDATGRIEFCRGLIPEPKGVAHLLPDTTAKDMKLSERVVGAYSARNSGLDENDVEEWLRSLDAAQQVA